MTSSHPIAATCQWFSRLARPLDRLTKAAGEVALYTVIDGKIARITFFASEDQALEAAGLSE